MSGKRQQAYRYGLAAEARAEAVLQEKGFVVVARRYRNRFGEIDLIARRGHALRFVEVKARKSLDDGLYALQPRQQQRMVQCALGFLSEHSEWQQFDMQFDLIAVAGYDYLHIENIVIAE